MSGGAKRREIGAGIQLIEKTVPGGEGAMYLFIARGGEKGYASLATATKDPAELPGFLRECAAMLEARAGGRS